MKFTPKDVASRVIAFVVTVCSILLVGSVCLSTAIKWLGEDRGGQAIVLAISYVVMLLGAGDAAKQVCRLFVRVLPGRSTAEI